MVQGKLEQRRRHSVGQIHTKLRSADQALAAGRSVSDICAELGITRQTYYRWRKQRDTLPSFGSAAEETVAGPNSANDAGGPISDDGVNVSRFLDRVRELEIENKRLRDAVVELMLDKMRLSEK